MFLDKNAPSGQGIPVGTHSLAIRPAGGCAEPSPPSVPR
ncbi:hypothetical protein F750_1839 [Streptomyces sp. PAMC 26508]|nr:hypothetical protein F750_1839 [Streptomyces sp. PAMC 26508]